RQVVAQLVGAGADLVGEAAVHGVDPEPGRPVDDAGAGQLVGDLGELHALADLDRDGLAGAGVGPPRVAHDLARGPDAGPREHGEARDHDDQRPAKGGLGHEKPYPGSRWASSQPCRMKAAASWSMTSLRRARRMPESMRARSTAAVEKRSSQVSTGTASRARSATTKTSTRRARGPISPSRVSG